MLPAEQERIRVGIQPQLVQRLHGLQALLLKGGEIEGGGKRGFHGAGSLAAFHDFARVLAYLWKAAYALLPADAEERESWVVDRATAVLDCRLSPQKRGP